jgi:hypothetical protein
VAVMGITLPFATRDHIREITWATPLSLRYPGG